MRATIFNNSTYTTVPKLALSNNIEDSIKYNTKTIHSTIAYKYLSNRNPNKIINQIPPSISKMEMTLTV